MNINRVSDPIKVYNNFIEYLKKHKLNVNNYEIYLSNKKNKKYMIYDKINDKYIHVGDINFEDFTKHNNKERQKNYLNRANNIKGDWKNNLFSSNNLSINLLWN